MIEYRIKRGETFIGAWLGGDNGNIVFCCGLPQYLDKYHPLVTQITRLGYNLFVPRYRGTFESDGDFSVLSSVQAIEDGISLANEGEAIELFNESKITWNRQVPLYVMGFSYGSLPALLSFNGKIDKTVLVCPFIDAHFHLGDASGENVRETFTFIERAYPHLYRLNSDQVIKDLLNTMLPDKKENLVIVSARGDTSIPRQEINLLLKKYPDARFIEKDGGHGAQIEDELLQKILKN